MTLEQKLGKAAILPIAIQPMITILHEAPLVLRKEHSVPTEE